MNLVPNDVIPNILFYLDVDYLNRSQKLIGDFGYYSMNLIRHLTLNILISEVLK